MFLRANATSSNTDRANICASGFWKTKPTLPRNFSAGVSAAARPAVFTEPE